MRFHATAIIAASLILGACAQSSERTTGPIGSARPQPVVAPQPIEPEAVRPGPVHNDKIVLLPKPNGQIGGVIVRSLDGGDELLLKTAYAGAHIGNPGGKVQSLTYDADRVKQEFGAVITALPSRPATFMLYFLEAKDELTPASESEVTRIFAELKSRPDPEIWVIGHTDAVGTVYYNDQLSLQRAERVRDELVRRGIPADSIEVAGRGKREPLIPTSEGISEPKNRRVEISVR
jgi:outer membrane protein OmpA-like peptidoglycan-associated protein